MSRCDIMLGILAAPCDLLCNLILKLRMQRADQRNSNKDTRWLNQTELSGVAPELKAAVKKFRVDDMQAERDWLKQLPLEQTTLDTRSKAPKDPKQVCEETEVP